MTDQQDPGFPPPEDGWMFTVPPPARCQTGRLPYPLIVNGPIAENRDLPDKKRWCLTVTRYAVYPRNNEISEWVDSAQGEGLGPFADVMVVFDNLWAANAGVYIYQVIMSLLDKESGIIERHVTIRSEPFSAEVDFDNSSIRLTDQAKEEARNAIVQSPLSERPELEQRFHHYL